MSWFIRRQLKSKSAQVRRMALHQLRGQPEKGVVPLIEALLAEESQPSVQVAAMEVLGSCPASANAWRCVDDNFRFRRLDRFPTRQLRWTYAEAPLTAIRRDDGCRLTVHTETKLSQDAEAALRSWIEAFLSEWNEGKGRKDSSSTAGVR